MMWVMFAIMMFLRLTGAPVPVVGWVIMGALLVFFGARRRWASTSGSTGSQSPDSYRQDPSFDVDSPSRVRTNWDNPGFNKR